MPNSSPVGSYYFFEPYNAFIHIDVKTVKSDSEGFRGKSLLKRIKRVIIPLRIDGEHDLPQYYTLDNNTEKLCLTYMLQVVYEAETYDIITIQLISVSNGQLYRIYGDAIVGKGKAGKTCLCATCIKVTTHSTH